MVIENQLFIGHPICRPLDNLSVYLGISVIFPALFCKMVVFLHQLIAPGKFSLTSQFGMQFSILAPRKKLHILVCIILKTVIDIIIAYRCTGAKWYTLSLVGSQRIGVFMKFRNLERTVQNKQM